MWWSPLGNETLVTVRVGDTLLNIRQPADFTEAIGTRLGVRPVARHLHLFRRRDRTASGPASRTLHDREGVRFSH